MAADWTPTERVALATWLLARGGRFTVRELSERLALTPRGSRYLLERLSAALPLIDDGGEWRLLTESDLQDE